jgi:cation transport regulator ChaB
MAEAHWREHLPQMVRELEAQGRLQSALIEAQDQATAAMDRLIREFSRQGLPPQQAHDRAWELVREQYLLLPPEPT